MLIPFLGVTQTTKPVDSFLGIKFGSTKEAVVAAMKAKGARIDPKNSKPDLLSFDGVKLGHRAVTDFYVDFVDNKAYEASFYFKVELEPKTVDEYKQLVSDLNEIYGPGEAFKKFKEPYTDGDGYEVTAIKTGNADYNTYWISGNGNSISLTIKPIDDELYLNLKYQDGTLIKIVIARQKAKEKSDF